MISPGICYEWGSAGIQVRSLPSVFFCSRVFSMSSTAISQHIPGPAFFPSCPQPSPTGSDADHGLPAALVIIQTLSRPPLNRRRPRPSSRAPSSRLPNTPTAASTIRPAGPPVLPRNIPSSTRHRGTCEAPKARFPTLPSQLPTRTALLRSGRCRLEESRPKSHPMPTTSRPTLSPLIPRNS